MRYPTITVPRARELIVQRHVRMHHSMSVESASADDCSRELRRRMLLIVTEPPHEKGTEHVFDLRLDPSHLHPMRQELLRDAENFTARTRASVRRVLQSTDTGLSAAMLAQGVVGLFLKSQGKEFRRRMATRRRLYGENEKAVADCVNTTAAVYSGQLNGGNPHTGEIWTEEENLAHRAWQAQQRIAELERRFLAGAPIEELLAEEDRAA